MSEPAIFATFPPRFRVLANLIGKRSDDPAVVAYVTEVGGKQPGPMVDGAMGKQVKTKLGHALWFSFSISNETYPLIPKGKKFIPYVTQVQFDKKWTEELPFGLSWKHTESAVEALLGTPIKRPLFYDQPEPILTWWERELEPGRTTAKITCGKKGLGLDLLPISSPTLTSRHGVPPRPVVGLLVGWLVHKNLLDESRFAAHRELLERIKRREAQGSALVDAALARGLWDEHLIPDEQLRRRAHQVMHGIGIRGLDSELVDVFGSRTSEHGHTQPVLDDDTWDAVDKATPTLDRCFER